MLPRKWGRCCNKRQPSTPTWTLCGRSHGNHGSGDFGLLLEGWSIDPSIAGAEPVRLQRAGPPNGSLPISRGRVKLVNSWKLIRWAFMTHVAPCSFRMWQSDATAWESVLRRSWTATWWGMTLDWNRLGTPHLVDACRCLVAKTSHPPVHHCGHRYTMNLQWYTDVIIWIICAYIYIHTSAIICVYIYIHTSIWLLICAYRVAAISFRTKSSHFKDSLGKIKLDTRSIEAGHWNHYRLKLDEGQGGEPGALGALGTWGRRHVCRFCRFLAGNLNFSKW